MSTSISHEDLDDLYAAIRAAKMIAEVISRTASQMSRADDGARWVFEEADGDLIDYFTTAQPAAIAVIEAKLDAAIRQEAEAHR